MTGALQIDVEDQAGTEVLGRRIGAALFPDAVIALVGPLGAGKTHLVRAIAEGLGIRNSRVVTSPTFVLVQEYEAKLPIFHFDAYRLSSEMEFRDLGVHEYFGAGGVSIIEWADRVPGCLPAENLRIEIEVTGDTKRRFLLEGMGEKHSLLTSFDIPSNTLRTAGDALPRRPEE